MSNLYYIEIYPMTSKAEEHYRKLYPETVTQLSADNAGVDIYTMSVEDKGVVQMVHSEIVVKMVKFVEGVEGHQDVNFYMAPRSSIWKSGVTMANSMGIIDRSYRGELMGACLPIAGSTVNIKEGDRLFQILAPDMDHIRGVNVKSYAELDETRRGSGGFGSTGK